MDRALDQRQLFHVKRAHAGTAEGDVNNLLVHRQNFSIQRVHIHSICEYGSLIKWI